MSRVMRESKGHYLRILSTCRHFTGIQHERCAAKVVYRDVRDASHKGPYRWPCLDRDSATACAKLSLPTEEEARKESDEIEAALKRMFDKLQRGVCITCSEVPTDFKQVGHCVYAVPCGHRVGQGNAAKYKKSLVAKAVRK